MTLLALSGSVADTRPVTRATAVFGGLAALLVTLASLGFAMYATGDGSVLGGLGKAVVLALSLAVASPPRAEGSRWRQKASRLARGYSMA